MTEQEKFEAMTEQEKFEADKKRIMGIYEAIIREDNKTAIKIINNMHDKQVLGQNFLFEEGQTPEKRTEESILHVAAIGGNEEVVEEILERGVEPDVINSLGRTPLMEAVKLKDRDMIELLVLYGANPTLKDPEGISILDHVIEIAKHDEEFDKIKHSIFMAILERTETLKGESENSLQSFEVLSEVKPKSSISTDSADMDSESEDDSIKPLGTKRRRSYTEREEGRKAKRHTGRGR